MADKLRDYQVLDVFCGGTFYKVKHKVTNNIFAWKAYNCSAYSSEQIQNVVGEVKSIGKLLSGSLLRYYDTILHGPTKTLYFVLEYNPWQTLQELIDVSREEGKYFSEDFIWHTLLEVVRACKELKNLEFVTLQKCITPASIFVSPNCELRINSFDLDPPKFIAQDVMQQVGYLIKSLCCGSEKIPREQEFMVQYSDDLKDVINFIIEDRNTILRPDVVLYHPTVLTNTDSLKIPKHISEILLKFNYTNSEVNKCDSEKAVDMCKKIKPLPRTHLLDDSPIYCNIVSRRQKQNNTPHTNFNSECLSPTVAALALELPGYVPRSRKPYSEPVTFTDDAQKVSQETLSHQWMSRLVALRQREESLNLRERDLLAKEIKNSPSTKLVCISKTPVKDSNGITLPPEINHIDEKKQWMSRRPRRRSGSVRSRGRRKSYAYEDLDSSLSADNGDSSMIITAAKITKENMPRNLFPDLSTKKVHFTPNNPFVDSDESVTLTFYELDNIDKEGYQVPRQDINKFKYLNVDASEKRGSDWCHSSPNKQAKISDIFSDVTNKSNLRKTPSKTSITSKSSNISRCSIISSKSQWSTEVGESTFERTRSIRQPESLPTPAVKKTKRKSLLPFKTPFKFMSSSTKI
ncbi:unnamed protein product [Pieris macdunnoughi]|uniref:non-specific serine/threonine protein kinase n=1 Tax=Pieris macdunnoughi TaxID=345717 RepID=A0A821VKR9_9NEOP|nr:unnamed protein product [Pieris macdunnoughi]